MAKEKGTVEIVRVRRFMEGGVSLDVPLLPFSRKTLRVAFHNGGAKIKDSDIWYHGNVVFKFSSQGKRRL